MTPFFAQRLWTRLRFRSSSLPYARVAPSTSFNEHEHTAMIWYASVRPGFALSALRESSMAEPHCWRGHGLGLGAAQAHELLGELIARVELIDLFGRGAHVGAAALGPRLLGVGEALGDEQRARLVGARARLGLVEA